MIGLTKLRRLDLAAAAAPGRPLFLSAASGLVRCKSHFYVIADDEHHLGVFPALGREPGRLLRIFAGDLPDPAPLRKKQKPDLEALALLPAHAGYPHGALLALGSGSRPNRRLSVLLPLGADGSVVEAATVIDLSAVLAPLDDVFPSVNIEGAVVCDGEFRLLQRGNKRHATNAIVRYALGRFLDVLRSGGGRTLEPAAVDVFDLGCADGLPLCFTDIAALPDGDMVFTAVTEDTGNAFDDGACSPAAVGFIGRDGALGAIHRLAEPHKVEGVVAEADGASVKLWLVTDADNVAIPAGLFTATIGR